MSQGHSAVRGIIYLETYEKKTMVGQVSKYNLKLLLKLVIGGLVGRWVVVLVSWLVGCPKGIGTGHIRDVFSHQNKLLLFEMEWERVTWTISTTNKTVQIETHS